MPKLQLTQQFVDNPPVVKSKTKIDYFDTKVTGFFLEVRATGKATYYQINQGVGPAHRLD